MNAEAERRFRAVYVGGTVFFGLLAWVFRLNLILGLAVMPTVAHLITAERARRAGKAFSGTPVGLLYRLVIGRELLAAGLFIAGAAYIAVRVGGAPRLLWLEAPIGLMVAAYVLLVRAVVQGGRRLTETAEEGGRQRAE